jgi:long-chain acyl-CoA synthetase
MKPGDIVYGFLPLYHIYGVVVNIILPLALNMKLLLQTRLDPREFMADFKKYRPHAIPAVPRVWEGLQKKIISGMKEQKKYTMFRIIMFLAPVLRKIGLGFIVDNVTQKVKDVFGGRLQALVSAGATLKPSTRKFFEQLGIRVGDGYGLTETTGAPHFNFDFIRLDGTRHIAAPLKGNELKIHNPNKEGIGEIWIRGNLVMKGYVDNDEANAAAFEGEWFKTGDLGMFDKKKRLHVKGRAKQIVVLDTGKNVYPDELEDLYLQNEQILSAAVFERQINGKTVPYGVFQVAPGTTIDQVKNLLRISNLQIAPYKWVTHFAITEDELPMTSAKKVQHFKLKEMVENSYFPDRHE